MRKIIFIMSIFALSSCKNSNSKLNDSEKNVTEQDIYEIVNLMIQQANEVEKMDGVKNSNYKYLVDRDLEPLFNKTDSLEILKSDAIFTSADKTFIKQQIEKRKDFKFREDSIKSLEIISADTIHKLLIEKKPGQEFYSLYKARFGDKHYYRIGLPVFSIDKKTVFVKFSGFGSGFTMVMRKKNGKWVGCKAGSNWIS